MESLSVRNLSKRFGAVEVLTGVDLEVEPGEFIVLVGPSGCGKSTLLAMIAGLETITSGEIAIAEANARADDAEDKRQNEAFDRLKQSFDTLQKMFDDLLKRTQNLESAEKACQERVSKLTDEIAELKKG